MVNRTPNTKQEQDDAYKPGALLKKEQTAAAGALIDVTKSAVDIATKTTTATRALAAVRSSEDKPWNVNINPEEPASKKVAFLNKAGPLGGIIVTLAAAFFGISGLIAPGLSIVTFAEILTNALNDAEPALDVRTTKMLARKADGLKNSFSESSEGKCNIKCKFGTMNDRMLRSLRSSGFDVVVETKKFGGRSIIKSITFPGKDPRVTVTNGAAFTEALKDPANAAKFYRVYSPTSYFLNSRFGTLLSRAFGLDKLPKITGSSREKVVELWRKTVGLQGASAAEDPTVGLPKEEKFSTSKFKPAITALKSPNLAKATNTIAGACLAYNTSKTVSYSVKAAKMAKFAAIALSIINLAHQIKAGDSPSPEAVEFAGNQLTNIDLNETFTDSEGNTSPNAYYGKNAFDSKGYKMASDNFNPGTLSAQEQAYGVKPTGALNTILYDGANLLLQAGSVAMDIGHVLCTTSGPLGIAVGFATSCSESIAAILASAGTATIGAAAWCVAKFTAITVGTMLAISKLLEEGVKMLVDNELSALTDETNTYGAVVGDIGYNGAAPIYGSTAASIGMKAGSQEEIRQFAIDTAEVRAQSDAIARYEASGTPFDVYNQHSFLGSLVSNLGLVSLSEATLASKLSKIGAIIPKSLATLSSSVDAATSNATLNNKAGLYSTDNDTSLAALGVASDAFGNPSYVMSSNELTMDGGEVAQWMIDNKQIDENSGKAKAGTDYERFTKYCANRYDSNGVIPLGETPSFIEEDDYTWKIGMKCQEESDSMSKFRVFTMDLAINASIDEEPGGKVRGESDDSKQALAQTIMESPNVTYNNIDNPGADIKDQIANIADGTSDGNTAPCQVNIYILRLIVGIIKDHSIQISDINRDCVNSKLNNTNSPHWTGDAIDIEIMDGATAASSRLLPILDIAVATIPKGSLIGLVPGDECRYPGVAPSYKGVQVFDDPGSCGHLHIGLPGGSDKDYK